MLVLAVALVGVGVLATIASARVFPLWILVLGQEHGRYAGLCASEPTYVGLLPSSIHNGIPIPEIGI